MKFKSILYWLIYWSGFNYLYSLFLNKRLFVVMYHSVKSKETSEKLYGYLYNHISVDVERFEEQMEYLKQRGHTFITFRDIKNIDMSKIKKPTVIYFDDGFKDVMINAVPIMEKKNIPATLFLVTGILDRVEMMWTMIYKEILSKKGLTEPEQIKLVHKIKMEPDTYRQEIMKKYSISNYPYLFDAFMTWNDVRGLSKSSIELGSHSISHPRLNEMSEEVLNREVYESKKRIEEETKQNVVSFSYPYGRGSEEVKRKLIDAGYKYIVSEGNGLNKIKETKGNHVFLKGISPKPNDSLMMFKLRMYSLNIGK